MLRPEVRQLECFIAVAEELNFTRAAERLNVVQQSLSEAIAQLETRIGVKLFDRTTRAVGLTEAGEAWLPHARAAFEAVDEAARAALDLAAGRTGRLRVGLAATGAMQLTPTLLRAYREAHETVEVVVGHFDMLDPHGGLRSGESDVALVRLPFVEDGLAVTVLYEEPRFAVLPLDHRLAGRAAIRFGEIAAEPWIDVDTDPLWCDFWKVAELRTSEPPVGARCRTLEDMYEAARTGAAVGLVAESDARSQNWAGLAFVRVMDVPPSRVAVAWRADDDRPGVQSFVSMAVELSRSPAGAAAEETIHR